jgi:calcium binding protein 39
VRPCRPLSFILTTNMNFFSKSTSSSQKYKNPADLVKIFVDNATKLDSLSTTAFSDGTPASQDVRKYTEEVTKTLRGMKSLLSSPDGGSNNADPQIDQATELSHLIFQSGLLKLLLKTMPRVDFEARKDGSNVFGLLLRRQVGSRCPGVDYVCREKELVGMALRG